MGGMLVELRDVMKYLAICMPASGGGCKKCAQGIECERHKGDFAKLESLLKKRKAALQQIGLPHEALGGGGALRSSAATGQQRGPARPAVRKAVGFSEEPESFM